MITEEINKLENIINKEIDGYKNIEKLYIDKKEILISGKADALVDVDTQIAKTFKGINDLFEERKTVSETLELPTFSLTDIINKVKDIDSAKAEKFEEKKNFVNELAQKIYSLEKLNLELTKHGIYMTNKTLEVMLKGVSTVTKEYNQKGQNIAKDQLEMSSIVEEA